MPPNPPYVIEDVLGVLDIETEELEPDPETDLAEFVSHKSDMQLRPSEEVEVVRPLADRPVLAFSVLTMVNAVYVMVSMAEVGPLLAEWRVLTVGVLAIVTAACITVSMTALTGQ